MLCIYSMCQRKQNTAFCKHMPYTHTLADQCFSTAEPRPSAGPWHQLYRATRGSPGICHFSFQSNFHE